MRRVADSLIVRKRWGNQVEFNHEWKTEHND